MEGKVKAGQLVLRAGVMMRSKQKKWCVFFNKAEDGPLLEFFENQEDAKKNSKHRKSHPLKQVKSIDTVSKSSSKDYYIDIHMKKERLTLCFDNDADLEDWSTVLHSYVIISSGDGGSTSNIGDEDDEGSTFKPNMLYESSEDTIAFDVTIEPTPASIKKHLDADTPYRLLVTMTNIYLEDPRKECPVLYRWMYEYIRSYGTTKSTGLFTISAGRKSETGEGEFSFRHSNPKSIDQAIDLQTQRKINLKVQQQHSRVEGGTEVSTENLRSSTSSKRPVSSPAGNSDHSEAGSRSSFKGKSEPFQKELSASIAARQSSKSGKKAEDKEKDKKEDKKGGFNLFGKKKDKKVKEHEKEGVENKQLQKEWSVDSEHIYDEAVPQITPILPPEGNMYSDVKKTSGNWKTHGQRTSEIHVENYKELSMAAKENKTGRNVFIPPSNDDDDDMYDTLDPKGGPKQKGAKAPEENLYGISSGRLLSGITPNSGTEEETYDDVASVQANAAPQVQYSSDVCEYETVDVPN